MCGVMMSTFSAPAGSAAARSFVRATIAGSMSNVVSLPRMARATGIENVPSPQPSSTTSPSRSSIPSRASTNGTSNSVSQYASSGMPLSRSFIMFIQTLALAFRQGEH